MHGAVSSAWVAKPEVGQRTSALLMNTAGNIARSAGALGKPHGRLRDRACCNRGKGGDCVPAESRGNVRCSRSRPRCFPLYRQFHGAWCPCRTHTPSSCCPAYRTMYSSPNLHPPPHPFAICSPLVTAAVGAIFAGTKVTASALRGHDDAFSSAVAGCAAGSMAGVKRKCVVCPAYGDSPLDTIAAVQVPFPLIPTFLPSFALPSTFPHRNRRLWIPRLGRLLPRWRACRLGTLGVGPLQAEFKGEPPSLFGAGTWPLLCCAFLTLPAHGSPLAFQYPTFFQAFAFLNAGRDHE